MATTTDAVPAGGLLRSRDAFDTRQWAVLALAVVTGLVHLYVGLEAGVPFYVAGVGWLVGAAVYLTSFWRRWMYLVAGLYAVVQIALWLLAGTPFFAIGVVDKVVEVAFLALVVQRYREG